MTSLSYYLVGMMLMNSTKKINLFAAIAAFSLSACGGAADHDHDHDAGHEAASSSNHAHDESVEVDHSRFGHMGAIYLCGNDELQTTHTDIETKLAYKGQKIDVSRVVSVIDNAFAGESFKGKFDGQTLYFRGKGYDASLKIGDEVISCEKISCIPLGGPHNH